MPWNWRGLEMQYPERLTFSAGSKPLPLTPYMQAKEIVVLLRSACCVNNTASGFPCLGCYR